MATTVSSRSANLLRVTKDTAYAPKPFFDLPNISNRRGGGGGIRTHVPGSSPDNPISSRARYVHFGTPPTIIRANLPVPSQGTEPAPGSPPARSRHGLGVV